MFSNWKKLFKCLLYSSRNIHTYLVSMLNPPLIVRKAYDV